MEQRSEETALYEVGWDLNMALRWQAARIEMMRFALDRKSSDGQAATANCKVEE